MYLNTILPRGRVVVPLQAETLREAMALLIQGLATEGALTDPDEVLRLVSAAATGDFIAIGRDVVLPHIRTDLVDDLVVSIGVAAGPLRTDESRGEIEPEVVVLVLAPPDATTSYLRTISALAGLLRQPGVVERIREARTAEEVLQLPEFQGLRIQPRLTVGDIMTHRPRSVSPETSVREAVDLMTRHRLRALPVVGEKGEVLGVIGEGDIMGALLPHLPPIGGEGEGAEAVAIPGALKVREIMTRSVLCIAEEMGVDEAANMMINKDVEQFPVVSEGRLSGFLTRGDIIRKLFGR